MSETTTFAALLAGRRHAAGSSTVTFEIPEDWQQGRTTFGGLIASTAVQAMRDVAGSGWGPEVQLRALQTSFIGPVDRGPVEVAVQVLREGRNVRQVQALVQQAGQTAAVLLGVFGSDRETEVAPCAPSQPPATTSAADAAKLPFLRGIAPNFTQHFDARWGDGAFPYSGKPSPLSRIHLRLKSEPVDAELLTVLMADLPPTPVISQFTRPVPASSVSWELELRPVADAPQGENDWWRVDTDVIAAAGGYVNQVTKLWTPGGELASIGYQVVAVYG